MKEVSIYYSNISNLYLSPNEDTKYILYFDADKCRQEQSSQKSINIELKTPNVNCKLFCACRVKSGQIFDITTNILHHAPNTSSYTLVKVVLEDGSGSRYFGRVIIKKTAIGSSSRLESRTLVLGEKAVVNVSEPIMQIENNNVTASHASTTGRLDENQVFYLKSRGLEEQEAKDMLVNAFLALPES